MQKTLNSKQSALEINSLEKAIPELKLETVLQAVVPLRGPLRVNELHRNTLPKQQLQARHSDEEYYSPHEKAALSVCLSRVCRMQKQYGKQAMELEIMVEDFCWGMEPYSMQEIIFALKSYIGIHSDIPSPANLKAILNPAPEPLSPAVYVAIRQKLKQGEYLNEEAQEYLREFERDELKKMKKNKILRGEEIKPQSHYPQRYVSAEKEPQHTDSQKEIMAKKFAELLKELNEKKNVQH